MGFAAVELIESDVDGVVDVAAGVLVELAA
jgi:hypothetical protein